MPALRLVLHHADRLLAACGAEDCLSSFPGVGARARRPPAGRVCTSASSAPSDPASSTRGRRFFGAKHTKHAPSIRPLAPATGQPNEQTHSDCEKSSSAHLVSCRSRWSPNNGRRNQPAKKKREQPTQHHADHVGLHDRHNVLVRLAHERSHPVRVGPRVAAG